MIRGWEDNFGAELPGRRRSRTRDAKAVPNHLLVRSPAAEGGWAEPATARAVSGKQRLWLGQA